MPNIKGDKFDCSNYRGIALLPVAYKILSIEIYDRLIKWAEKIIGEYQSGFRPGRSTVDHIFYLRMVLEKFYENDIDLHHLYIDFRQAYDTVIREEVLEVMHWLGIPKKLIRLIKMTWKTTTCQVKIGRDLSEEFHVV